MSELTKTKLNYIFVFLTVSSFLLLNWSIDGLNPAKNAVDLGSMNLDEERLCVGFDEKNFFDIEVNHSSEDLFSVTGKGIFKIGKNNQSNSFSAFATFDPLGKLFGAKLLLHLAGRNLEIELKGAENTEVSIRIKNSMEERTLGVFHLEGPLIFVDMEKLNDNNQASFSFLSTNLLIKNASVRDVRTFIREKLSLKNISSDGSCELSAIADEGRVQKILAKFDRVIAGNLKTEDEIVNDLNEVIGFKGIDAIN